MKKVVLYGRSATCKEEVDRQIQMMRDTLDPGVDVVGQYSDLVCGTDTHQPGLQRALRQVLVGDAEGLMVTSLDRLTRSLPKLARLQSMFRIEISTEPENLG